MSTKPRTLFEKIWDEHVVYDEPGRQTIALRRLAPCTRGDEPPGI